MPTKRVLSVLLISISLTTLIFQGCRSQSTLSRSLDSLAQTKVGPSPVREFNASRAYILFKEKNDAASYTEGPLKFAVYRLADHKLMTEGIFSRGYVKWLSDSVIEVQNIPQKVKHNQNLEVYKRQIYIEGLNH